MGHWGILSWIIIDYTDHKVRGEVEVGSLGIDK